MADYTDVRKQGPAPHLAGLGTEQTVFRRALTLTCPTLSKA
jgi:hypothetical protein